MDYRYFDTDPIFNVCTKAQAYYEQHSIPTRVKACSVISVDECMQLAGVAAFTIAPSLLQELADAHQPVGKLDSLSVFDKGLVEAGPIETFGTNELKFRAAFAKSDGGKGRLKTMQVGTFSIYWCDHLVLMQ